jgi:GT2 family glycosyltransferase
MPVATTDIVIPVWNKPGDTRNCLVNLINFTPDARLIMMDCGSERETEKLLQELADGLDERALLMRDDSNIGFVRAANRGLGRTDAPFVAVVRSTTQVSAGWLEPLLAFARQNPEAGILVPQQCTGHHEFRRPVELAVGSFAAMVIRRELFELVGGFDEGMDGGQWCLKDYSRRACAKGFYTYLVPGPGVSCQDELQLGSQRRREETLEHSRELYLERWGSEAVFLVHVPKGVDATLLTHKMEMLLKGARHGNSYFVLLPAALGKQAHQLGFDALHENIRLVPLPRLSTESGRRRIFEHLLAEHPGIRSVAAVDGIPFPWSTDYLQFTELAEQIRLGYL